MKTVILITRASPWLGVDFARQLFDGEPPREPGKIEKGERWVMHHAWPRFDRLSVSAVGMTFTESAHPEPVEGRWKR